MIDENRTHGADSAIDDEMPPISPPPPMAEALPGAEAVPADMPNSPHGDVPLEYSLQNFNALVAANTAMQTAISDGELREQMLHRQIGQLEEAADDMRNAAAIREQHANEARERWAADKKERDDLKIDVAYHSDRADELQRKLDRTHGYLDRFLDEEASLRAPDSRSMPAPLPAVGPDLGGIPRAMRRSTNGRASDFSGYAEVAAFDPAERRRRY